MSHLALKEMNIQILQIYLIYLTEVDETIMPR